MNNTSALWRTDPATLRDKAIDRKAIESALAKGCSPTDRVRFLTLLNREGEAIQEGFDLLADSSDRRELLLVLAQAFQHQYRWYEAGQLQEEALQLAATRPEESNVRHPITKPAADSVTH